MSPELADVCQKIHTCISLRKKYMEISCQAPGMNPEDTAENEPEFPDVENVVLPEAGNVTFFDLFNFQFSIFNFQFSIFSDPPFSILLPFGSISLFLHSSLTELKMESSHFMTPKQCLVNISSPFFWISSISFFSQEGIDQTLSQIPTIDEFVEDLEKVIRIASEGSIKTFAFNRLNFLQTKFDMYLALNELEEHALCKVFALYWKRASRGEDSGEDERESRQINPFLKKTFIFCRWSLIEISTMSER